MAATAARSMNGSTGFNPGSVGHLNPSIPGLSSSYRPRPHRLASASEPASPVVGEASTSQDRGGSSLRHELKEAPAEPEEIEVDDKVLEQARNMLNVSVAATVPISDIAAIEPSLICFRSYLLYHAHSQRSYPK